MSKSLASAGIKLSILTLGSRLLGLVREMTKASFLGTSGLADAFGVAFMIPNLFRRLFAENSISVAFIPTFKAYLEKNPEENASKILDMVDKVFPEDWYGAARKNIRKVLEEKGNGLPRPRLID